MLKETIDPHALEGLRAAHRTQKRTKASCEKSASLKIGRMRALLREVVELLHLNPAGEMKIEFTRRLI
jgi:hypothetical protein